MSTRDASPERKKNPLHTVGYRVYRKVIQDIPNSVIQALKSQARTNAKAIFNSIEKEDWLRSQFRHRKRVGLTPFFDKLEQSLKRYVPLGFQPSPWFVLRSQEGCGKQPAHCDYEVTEELVAATDEQMPLAMLVALMPNTCLDVWPNSIRLVTQPQLAEQVGPIARQTVLLSPGDVLVFRGDMIHAGAAYEELNIRLHRFLDSPFVKRRPNGTCIIHKHEDRESVRNAIQP